MRGIRRDGRLGPELASTESDESTMPLVPAHWDVSSVDAEFEVASGFTLGPHRHPRTHPHPYLRVANVYRDRLELDDIGLLEALPRELEGRTLALGDLLVIEGHANPNEIGRCAIATEAVAGMAFQNHLFRLRALRLNRRFALVWLNSRFVRSYWRRVSSSSSGLSTINQSSLRDLAVVVPPQEEQDAIADLADAFGKRLRAETRLAGKLRCIRTGLAADLVLGRVRTQELLRDVVA